MLRTLNRLYLHFENCKLVMLYMDGESMSLASARRPLLLLLQVLGESALPRELNDRTLIVSSSIRRMADRGNVW